MGVTYTSIYNVFKRLRGRPILDPNDVPRDLKLNITVEQLIRIYSDSEVQAQIRRTLDPLRLPDVDVFQTRRAGQIIASVSKSDLQAADEAELESLTTDEEIVLGIEKAAWRRSLSWHFSDGRTSFDARIEDNAFWKTVEQGLPFSEGDRMRVHLRTTARRTANGTLKVERRIPTVISVEHRRNNQEKLSFGKDEGDPR